ncbi:hypothetical protein GQ457_17G021950 [Hibiscus cannabinus]
MPVYKTESDGDCCSSTPDWARNRKRRREDVKKENVFAARLRRRLIRFPLCTARSSLFRGRDTVPTASTCSRRGWRHSLSLCGASIQVLHSINVVEFELPRQQCVVYLDLKREECAHLFPAGRVLFPGHFILVDKDFTCIKGITLSLEERLSAIDIP